MTVLNLLASFFAASLAAMGVGGGGLLVLYLVFVLGYEQLPAQGLNLLFFICASACSLPLHFIKKRVMLKTALLFAVTGAVGAVIGCYVSAYLPKNYTRIAFGAFITVAGVITLYKTFISAKKESHGHKNCK